MPSDKAKEIPNVQDKYPKKVDVSTTDSKELSQRITESDLERLANQLYINENEPPTFQNLTLPLMNADLNSLGCAVTRGIYEKMIKRSTKEDKNQLYERKVDFANQFIERVHEHQMPIARNRKPGQTAFHFANDKRINDIHAYYFNKTSKEWKHPYEDQVRAYITVESQKINEIGKYFADLCTVLYKKGIDFNAKSADPYGASARTDNMVFYISKSDTEEASKLIKTFLAGRKIADGHVLAALPDDDIKGLSWAYEPSREEHELWKRLTGDKDNTSFNALIALKVAPRFFHRLAKAHTKLGHVEEASKFLQLAAAASQQ